MSGGRCRSISSSGFTSDQVVDTTGCGDSFAGGLAFGYLRTRDYIKACHYGNAAGAQRCTGTEIGIYKNLEETEQQIAETYGPQSTGDGA